jgi:hypothetical protein
MEYYLGNEMKDNENARHVARLDRNAYNILVGKPERKTARKT